MNLMSAMIHRGYGALSVNNGDDCRPIQVTAELVYKGPFAGQLIMSYYSHNVPCKVVIGVHDGTKQSLWPPSYPPPPPSPSSPEQMVSNLVSAQFTEIFTQGGTMLVSFEFSSMLVF